MLHELRSDERTSDIPVIIHSSHTIADNEKPKIAHQGVTVWPKSRVQSEDAVGDLLAVLASLGIDLGEKASTNHG